jgi:hypothetical protein
VRTHVVAHEEIVGVGGVAADAEELDEVVELAVDVAADGDGAPHRLHVPFLHEDGFGLLAERLHLRLREVLALAQLRDLPVQIPVRRHLRRRRPAAEVAAGGSSSGKLAGGQVGLGFAGDRQWWGRRSSSCLHFFRRGLVLCDARFFFSALGNTSVQVCMA